MHVGKAFWRLGGCLYVYDHPVLSYRRVRRAAKCIRFHLLSASIERPVRYTSPGAPPPPSLPPAVEPEEEAPLELDDEELLLDELELLELEEEELELEDDDELELLEELLASVVTLTTVD